ncbi:chorion class CB protein M5H4-like [Bombyx mandarina]|uniref:Chorion class CB protein M5H4-like n=1 Tax=Bombyx mandarina TaxID=7092 RepID=A0A6J2JHS3_BOMMA|nr:chorion class CB protein M5H4-like [Bombyx mandarina]
MAAKTAIFVSVSALLWVSAASQYLGRDPLIGGLGAPCGPWGPYDGIGYDGLGYGGLGVGGFIGLAPGNLAASCGGGFTVTSTSPIAPTGITVTSENAIEGSLAVIGQLPFLGTVVTEGTFPSNGRGLVSYGCGDGAIGIVSETPVAALGAPVGPGLGYGPGIPPVGFGYKGIGPGCGCGGLF